jgi:hypothetical protein
MERLIELSLYVEEKLKTATRVVTDSRATASGRQFLFHAPHVSTFDKRTHHSPKLEEFREIIRELTVEENRKVVVFSEYERMTFLAGEELRKMGIGFVSLHGGVPSRKRGALIETFQSQPTCRVFLSTDAGGVGLNLQAASAVINFEPPWNPARLEQRIGRVHRLGQANPVQVIHFLTEKTIEERVWETLQLKKSLFAGVFDSPVSEVSFAKLGRKSVLQQVKEIFANQPGRPKPVIDTPPPQAIRVGETTTSPPAAQSTVEPSNSSVPTSGEDGVGDVERAAVGLAKAGLAFLHSVASEFKNCATAPGQQAHAAVSSLFSRHPRTNQPMLAVPLPQSFTAERITRAVVRFLSALEEQA